MLCVTDLLSWVFASSYVMDTVLEMCHFRAKLTAWIGKFAVWVTVAFERPLPYVIIDEEPSLCGFFEVWESKLQRQLRLL